MPYKEGLQKIKPKNKLTPQQSFFIFSFHSSRQTPFRGGSRTATTFKKEHFMIIELHPWCCSSPRSVSAIGYTESINGVLVSVADVEDTTDCCKDNRKAEYDENNTKKLYALSPLVSLYRWSVVSAVKENLSEYKPFND